MMKPLLERFLRYVRIDTQSSDQTKTHPSTAKQFDLARMLEQELNDLGLNRVRVSPQGYVFAELPASPGMEHAPVLGLLAHMDTSDGASGTNVNPQLIVYQGGIIPLGTSGKVLNPAVFPALKKQQGKTLITTDGTTLLGADDKAGITEIMTALEQLIAEKRPHGKLCIGFTPDEEIGEGTDFFDIKDFGADYAYTMDGGGAGILEYQNFNAAVASFEIQGISVHPGSAKGVMRNAQKLAMELDAMFPPDEVPEKTCGLEGFYHLIQTSGTVGQAKLVYLLRDHHADAFELKKKKVREIADAMNLKYGPETVKLTLRDQYRNMEEIIRGVPFLVDTAKSAIRKTGMEPVTVPIRGGTDGAQLSWKGLPCPNLATGGYNYHGECEYAVMEEMESAVRMLRFLIDDFSKLKPEELKAK